MSIPKPKMVKTEVKIMQNYAYDRNYNGYKRVNRYRYSNGYSSVSRSLRYARRVLAALCLMLVQLLVCDTAVTIYKGVLGCVATIAFIGIIGGIEAGTLPLAFGFILAFSTLGFAVCKLIGKGIDI